VIWLVYMIARELLEDEWVGVLAAVVMALDGLPLVMSRIGMNDMYFLLFMLATYWLFVKEKYGWSALTLGLAAASKWTVFWMVPLLGVIFVSMRKRLSFRLGWLVVVPVLVYIASYGPMFWTGHDWETFIGVQKQMWWYHTKLDATHPYTSPWWSWPILMRPIWLFTWSGGRLVSNIYAMGNPVVTWAGLAAVGYVIVLAVKKKARKLGLIVFSYLMFFVPWAASPRIMFLYHYLPSVPFMAIALAVVLRRHRVLVVPFMVVAGMAFVYLYPHWVGMKVPLWWDRSYYWFSSWR